MKVLIINGSAHKGNTWTIVEIVKTRMQKISNNSIVFDEIHLREVNLPMCTGCNACYIKGNEKCPHHIIVQKIIDKIEETDATIVISPCYSNNVSALIKNLIDHMSYITHRPSFFTKKVLAVSTTGGKGSKFCTKYLRETFMCWGFNRGYELPIVSHSYGGYVPSPKDIEKSNKATEVFYNDIASGKLYSPTFVNALVYNIFRGMSTVGTPEELYDNRYWKETGLINVPYSTEVPVSLYKRVLGNVIYYFARKMAAKTPFTYKK
ncbi:MAG: multimeric flavodoxin WrbA [Clostridium sp.]|jgi:multimeric flavodoxin WrbA